MRTIGLTGDVEVAMADRTAIVLGRTVRLHIRSPKQQPGGGEEEEEEKGMRVVVVGFTFTNQQFVTTIISKRHIFIMPNINK